MGLFDSVTKKLKQAGSNVKANLKANAAQKKKYQDIDKALKGNTPLNGYSKEAQELAAKLSIDVKDAEGYLIAKKKREAQAAWVNDKKAKVIGGLKQIAKNVNANANQAHMRNLSSFEPTGSKRKR